ncbi:putative phosphodiesterase [Actinokineospora baliensis]|uniref:metallophosphoesterase n=1 Tax=Actinokineospora baliensis TaxID=547056 RepID=UPI001958824D|nr:metallophosphoesterase [Actinokineospora baliensis]MBM7771942.1 putative phosphodiesterase [Actinokineospora baliensis]
MTKRYVVISDTQMPYEDRKALRSVIRFVADYQPDEVVQIGDLMDFPQPSRWSKDTAAEFQGSVFEDAEYAKRNFFSPLRDVYDGPIGVIEGNHDLRPREYLAKYAPALAESGAFTLDVMLDFDGFGARLLPDFYPFSPGWIMTHGHLGKIGLSQIAGNTALNAARRFGSSVIMGHTHRMGIGAHTSGYGGEVGKTLVGMEVGNLMDMRQAGYLKGGTGNWQQGFALVTTEEKTVQPELVFIEGKRFSVDGVLYRL